MGDKQLESIFSRERDLFAACLRTCWRLSLSYALVILLYVLVVHDATPIRLLGGGGTFPEWLPHVAFRAGFAFVAVLCWQRVMPLARQRWFGWATSALGSLGILLVVLFIYAPGSQWPLVLGSALSAYATFYLACLMLSLGCRIGVAQNLRAIILAAFLAIPAAPIVALFPTGNLLYVSPALPLAIYALLSTMSGNTGGMRALSKVPEKRLVAPWRFLLTGLLDGAVYGIYASIGGSGGENVLLLMIVSSALASIVLAWPIIVGKSTYNDTLFRLEFPLGALGFLLIYMLGADAWIPRLVFFSSFVMRYITVYTLNIYHVSRYELPFVWVGGYADCARNVGQVMGFAIPTAILPGMTGAQQQIAGMGMVVCLLASVYLQRESNDRSGWGHARVDEQGDDPASDIERTCARIASENALSKREREVLTCLAQGNSQRRTAELLYIGVETVKTHSQNIYRKLGVHTKQELIDLVRSRTEG